jgi:mycothiol S-conjugate amidase
MQTSITAQRPDFQPYGIESLWFNEAPAKRRILIAYAHPDDESFGNAGTIARYAAEGVAVHYACATRGESGEVAPSFLQTYQDIAALRTAELTCAARTLNLAAAHLLGYRDSGMLGSSDNDNPDSLHRASLGRVAGQLVALIRALQPQVVITFNTYGGYGHPDHIKIHRAAIAAFFAAGTEQYPEQLAAGLTPWRPSKLYLSTFGPAWLRFNVRMMQLMRRDPSRVGANKDIDLVRALSEVTDSTTLIDSRAYLDQKQAAWLCHASQLGGITGRLLRLPRPVRRRFTAFEQFTRVVPRWDQGQAMERDLFEGID